MDNSTSGNIFIVVAPSGAGKSSLVSALLQQEKNIILSVSCTTRAPRPGEENNRHYRFVTVEEFKQLRDQNKLLEWAEVHGNYYGTPRDRIDQALKQGQDVLLEIDWQGAQLIKKHFPHAIGIFILPPSLETLKQRLITRAQDTTEVIERRLEAASSEISHASECEYVIINQEFSIALQQLAQVISVARLSYRNQANRYRELFSQLGIK